jgi:hypothetical protein
MDILDKLSTFCAVEQRALRVEHMWKRVARWSTTQVFISV